MSKRLAPQYRNIYLGAVRNVALDCQPVLDDGETITGTPTVTDDSGLLEITAVQVNASAIDVNGVSVPAGRAVQWKLDRNGAAAGTYVIDVVIETSAGQTIPGGVAVVAV